MARGQGLDGAAPVVVPSRSQGPKRPFKFEYTVKCVSAITPEAPLGAPVITVSGTVKSDHYPQSLTVNELLTLMSEAHEVPAEKVRLSILNNARLFARVEKAVQDHNKLVEQHIGKS